MFRTQQRVDLLVKNHTPSPVSGRVWEISGRENLLGDHLLPDSQLLRYLRLRHPLAQTPSDPALWPESSATAGTKAAELCHSDVVQLSESVKHSSKSSSFLGRLDGGASHV